LQGGETISDGAVVFSGSGTWSRVFDFRFSTGAPNTDASYALVRWMKGSPQNPFNGRGIGGRTTSF
jgi:hypothetical protein